MWEITSLQRAHSAATAMRPMPIAIQEVCIGTVVPAVPSQREPHQIHGKLSKKQLDDEIKAQERRQLRCIKKEEERVSQEPARARIIYVVRTNLDKVLQALLWWLNECFRACQATTPVPKQSPHITANPS